MVAPVEKESWPLRLVRGLAVAFLVIAAIILTLVLVARYALESLPDFLARFLKYYVGYGRGAGKIPDCDSDLVKDAGLCYPECPEGYKGVGPVCWEDCPSDMTDIGVSCQKKSYGRGAGTVPNVCPSGLQNEDGLCYPGCKYGYNGVGPVCWQECPSGFADVGVSCAKPKPYGRGGGYITKGLCEDHHDSCERWGLLWYPKCDDGFHNVGCCICSPDCPDGMTDEGEFCAKHSYGRGAGKVPKDCASDEVDDAGLCYKKCKSGYEGSGPVCWEDCPDGMKDTGADCLKESKPRGAGTVPDACPSGKVNDAGLCYPGCESGYKGVGPMCWAEWFRGG